MNKENTHPTVKRKVRRFLMENGYDIKNMTEEEMLNTVDEVIRYSKDDKKKPKDLQKTADDADEVVQGYDEKGDPITVTPGEDITEEDIVEMVKESQSPVMSKEQLMTEVRRRLINEENAYENELTSGDNPYSKHIDPDVVRDLGRRIFNDVRQAAQTQFGDATRAQMEMGRSLMNILQYEMDKKPQLEEEAIRLIREKHPLLTPDAVNIVAVITGHPELGGREVHREDLKYEKSEEQPPEGYTEEDLKDEVTKRRFINAMGQGSARKSQNLHHLADESRIPRNMRDQYAKLMAANDYVYWAMSREQIRQQGRSGVHAGNVKTYSRGDTFNGETVDKPIIMAQGMTFSILLHELEKGAKELLARHFGQNRNRDIQKWVHGQTDHLDAEQDDIRMGVGIWEKITEFIDIENPKHESFLYQQIVSLPANEMNSLIRGLLNDNENSVRKMREMSEDVSEMLRQEEYREATGYYDEPEEEGPSPETPTDQPEKQPQSEEPDFSTMSKSELEDWMNHALDTEDYKLAAEVGKYLHR